MVFWNVTSHSWYLSMNLHDTLSHKTMFDTHCYKKMKSHTGNKLRKFLGFCGMGGLLGFPPV